MLEVLTFIFSGFWVWVGTVVLIGALGSSASSIVRAIRGRCDCDEI